MAEVDQIIFTACIRRMREGNSLSLFVHTHGGQDRGGGTSARSGWGGDTPARSGRGVPWPGMGYLPSRNGVTPVQRWGIPSSSKTLATTWYFPKLYILVFSRTRICKAGRLFFSLWCLFVGFNFNFSHQMAHKTDLKY